MSSLTQIIRRNVQLHGEKTATRFFGRSHSWREFQERISRLASGLKGLGVEEGDRVAILALNSDRYYEFYFAASWAGAVFVPVNTRLAPAEFVHWLNDSGSKAVFAGDEFVPALAEIKDQLDTVQHMVYLGESETPDGYISFEDLVAGHQPVAPSARSGDDLAGLFYTGGTTGKSKG
jgi:acyl-CoA synthetase (AMP-forming)/AMP-acid ligase II